MGARKRKIVDALEHDLCEIEARMYTGAGSRYSTTAMAIPYAYGSNRGSGSSTNPIVLDSPSSSSRPSYAASPAISSSSQPAKAPPVKRQRKQKDLDTPEKRGAIFKKKCPQNILERADRVREQRMFLLDRTRNGNELREEFAVQGSTGNVYTVIVDRKPSCDCPDAMKGNHCKHILFIFMKVLQVTQDSGYWYQKALLTTELEDIFSHAPLTPIAVADARVRAAYAKATGRNAASASQGYTGKKRLPDKDDDCPVCYEHMYQVAENTLSFCDQCGNALHKECFQQWIKAARGNATCVFCRAPVASSSKAKPTTGARTSEGYINLATQAGISPIRDTSSYYHGPRRGSRYYGYQNYADDLYC